MMKNTAVLISETLIGRGIYGDLNQEMTDHYHSLLEEKIDNGIAEDKALEQVFDQIKADDLTRMNRKIFFLNHKNVFLSSALSLIGVILVTLWGSTHLQEEKQVVQEEVKYNWPLAMANGNISAKYDQKRQLKSGALIRHKGIDIAANTGTPVLSPYDAIVLETGNTSRRGNYIILKHHNGYTTRYFHLSEILVKIRESVNQNTVIGRVGSTGKSSGPHLHYEVIKDREHLDPETISVKLP
ncbi:peptidoglycan DD-metalloendopeptidase family protein [Leptobacterium flavescens]|uniref:Peptidoglycan DD-metalloendopeptidase family protein n=1 Tax=Leptobacterium flavescens TaxID=472055 RepID=A0A6P0UTB0_9FLAO|nr:M23 family metallopeptidase [Leptobacterium flavescens]NER13646.1 peptidoglycan DD-metalloendopeptidase family protein [Leptobacterium flavescens]